MESNNAPLQLGLTHFLSQADGLAKFLLIVLFSMSVITWYLIASKSYAKVRLLTLRRTISAEYWQGNTHSQIQETQGNLWATLNRLHMGTGMGAWWILLGDSLALGLFVLTASGLLLWSRLHGPRLLALGLIGTCLLLALSLVVISL